jgi:hypothetical protein
MKFFRGFFSVIFICLALFGGSQPPASPGNPIKDLIEKIFIEPFTCSTKPKEPLTKTLAGTWRMSLVNVSPELPDLSVADPIKKSSTWKISGSGRALSIRYDGSMKWYKEPPLVSFEVSSPSVTTYSNDTRCLFSGSGKTYMKTFIKIWEFPPSIMSNISVNYTDTVSITMNSDDRITAVIKATVGGQFTERGKINPINAVETITYTGVRK